MMGRNNFNWRIIRFMVLISIQLYCSSATEEPKIVIIGAGPAGLAAGTKLLEYGFKDLTILEAEPRIGGRIKTIPFADNVIDLGAQWCHGEKGNPVYQMVKDLNLLDHSDGLKENITLVRSNGEILDEKTQGRLSLLEETIRENREKHENEKDKTNVYDFLQNEIEKAFNTPEYKDIDKALAAEFLKNLDMDECCYEAADSMKEMSIGGDESYETADGDQTLHWKGKGYKQFLKVLLKTEETGKEYGVLQDQIRILKQVKEINWQRDDHKVLIKCEDGEEILADHVIVTVSLGVLKAQHEKLFEPDLPSNKQKAIENINFGTVNKIFLEFEKPFWPETFTDFQIYWREQDLKEIRGTDRAWLEGIFGFHIVHYQPRVLEGWLVGSFGRNVETLPEETMKKEILALIERCLPWNVTNVVGFKTTDWFTNPHFRGTYSYHSIKTEDAGVKPIDLEEPLFVSVKNCEAGSEEKCQRPVVLFGGEATHTKHYSTVHGAVGSGWREAKRLAEFYGKGI